MDPRRRFADRVAIVTGAASGIGRAIAERLGREGAAVAVNHLPGDEARAQEVVSGLERAGGRGLAVAADVGQVAAIGDLVERTLAAFGRLDILVNNAAWAIQKPVDAVTEAELDQLLAINVKGTFFGCQLAARHLGPGGRIINLSSSTTALTLPGYAAYDATKGAVEQLTRVLARELGPRGITVNAVSPGATETEQFRTGKSEAQIQQLAAMAALGRLGTPPDIADVVAFVASDEARWITGQILRVNGGTA